MHTSPTFLVLIRPWVLFSLKVDIYDYRIIYIHWSNCVIVPLIFSLRELELMPPALCSFHLIWTTYKKWGLTCFLFSTHIHDKPLLPSLPICMKPCKLSLDCPREVAKVSSSYKDSWSLLLSPTVSTVWSQNFADVERHLTFKKNLIFSH